MRRPVRRGPFALVAVLLAACGGSDEPACVVDSSYDPPVDPAAFVSAVDNPLYPLVPGTIFRYSEGADVGVEVSVLAERREILGVSCTVVHDVQSEGGEVVEDTLDFFAQDAAGNVWYFGEETSELVDGQVVSTEGSWEAGVDGAKPGMIILAAPVLGQQYRQEYLACEAEDMGEIVALDEAVTVPFGSFTGCLKTRDFTPLEPDVDENKLYCPGVGLVLSIDTATGDREELDEVVGP